MEVDKFFNDAFVNTLDIEGEYVNHPYDRGGETNYGITKNLARHYNYHGDMREIPMKKVREIYYKEFWKKNHYDKFHDRFIAKEMFDVAVNIGARKANRKLQQSYNLLPKENKLATDGIIGNLTLTAINGCSIRDKKTIFNILNGYQAGHYIKLAEKDPKQRAFIAGWFNKRINIKRL